MDLSVTAITPERAALWLSTMPYEKQRTVRRHWVLALSEMMLRKEFLERDPIIIGVVGAKEFLLDGQHRLSAVVDSGVTISVPVLRVICASEEEVYRHYHTIDSGLSRTVAEMYPQVAELIGTTDKKAHAAMFAAVGLIDRNYSVTGTGPHSGREIAWKRGSKQHRLELVRTWADEGRRYFGLISGYDHTLFRRAAVVAVGLMTLRHQPDQAAEFWGGAAKDDGLAANDPRKVMLHYLRQTQNALPNQANDAKMIARFWNAFFAGKRYTRIPGLRPEAKRIPIVIFGTPVGTDETDDAASA